MSHPIPNALIFDRLGIVKDRLIVIDDRYSVTAKRLREAMVFLHITDTCWLFEGYRPSSKHGRIEYREQQIYMHRAIDAALHGPLPIGIEVCHECDVSNCILPSHLFRGTQIDNIADMLRKGRGVNPPIHRGEQHYAATLTDAEVATLRATASGKNQRQLAAEYGVSQSTIWRLIHKQVRA